MITQFDSQEQVIKTWKEANEKKKEAEEQIKLCKMAIMEHNVQVDTPIYDGWGIIQKTRKTYIVPREVMKNYVSDENDYIEVMKTKFEDYLDQSLENGTMTQEMIDDIKSQYIFAGEKSHYELKKL